VGIGDIAHQCRYRLQARSLRGSPTPFAGDGLVLVDTGRPHENGLQDAELADRRRQRHQRLLVEARSGLEAVRRDLRDRELL
jgi:hypothetical protein